MTGVITVSEPSWTAPFTGLSPRCFGKLITTLRREGADEVRPGQPWSLSLEDRILLVAACRRRAVVLIADGTLVPTRDRTVAEQSKNYRYSTNHQVVIDADTRLVVVVGRPLPRNGNDCRARELSGAKTAVGKATVIADGGYRGTGLVIPHRRVFGQAELPAWKEDHNASHRRVRGRAEHAFAHEELEDPPRVPPEGDGVHHAMLGIARPHNLANTG
ncbi:hypothetical protein ABIE67_008563 [Streptomyces sp. V4I8]